MVAEETGMPEADAERLCERLRVHMEVLVHLARVPSKQMRFEMTG